MKSDNIVAISTALSPSGVAVIRISGDSPLQIAEKMFKPVSKINVSDFIPNTMYAGEILCDTFNDFGLCVYFKAPKSFTGENTVEFHSHGGIAIAQGVLKKALSLGARLAKNGEFTKRAFLNGKLSLSSCEGLIDMINSESVSGVKAGYNLYREKLTAKINGYQNELTDALGEINADMDFPEEDLEVSAKNSTLKALKSVNGSIEQLLSSYNIGRALAHGVKVGIIGKPNTGKSSILNALLNYDKAIVSNVAGTTRDIVEGSIDINGVRFNFSDTAGIHDTDDEIESLGVSLSNKTLLSSDLLLFIINADDFTADDEKILDEIKDKNHITVINKCDISKKEIEGDIKVSALTKFNIESLRQAVYDKAIKEVDVNGDFLCEERHYEALKKAKSFIESALSNIDKVSLDMLAIDVKNCWDALGEISGVTATEEIIDNIFSRFCVGK